MLKILAVDDHPIFRKGLVSLIQEKYVDAIIEEAKDGNEAIALLNNEKFDFVILDIDMPGKSGLEVLDYIKEKKYASKNIILSMHNDEMFFNDAFNRGAHGFLLKEDSSFEIIECMHSVKMGIPFISTDLKPFVNNREKFNKEMSRIKDALESLTKVELNTLKLVAKNKTSKEIASLLFLTEKSVENYRSRICKKMGVSGVSNSLYKWSVENSDYIG